MYDYPETVFIPFRGSLLPPPLLLCQLMHATYSEGHSITHYPCEAGACIGLRLGDVSARQEEKIEQGVFILIRYERVIPCSTLRAYMYAHCHQ